MRTLKTLLFLFVIFFESIGQDHSNFHRIAFYNVENLFDTIDTPLKSDEEFTPSGLKGWNSYRLHSKINRIYKVLIALGEWELPAIIGFSEIENQSLLKRLVKETPLVKYNYEYLSEDSDDKRGIEVGLIFRKDIFLYGCHELLKIPLERPTRDILYVRGQILGKTYHIYINHWPSRIGGKEHTENLRLAASRVLMNHLDSISKCNASPRIIIMGDFNDEPGDQSLKRLTNQRFLDKEGNTIKISNSVTEDDQGTVTYSTVHTEWFWFDQILVSDNVEKDKIMIFRPDWLLDKNGRPKRTYLGDYYNNGFSDHLPVYLDIYPE